MYVISIGERAFTMQERCVDKSVNVTVAGPMTTVHLKATVNPGSSKESVVFEKGRYRIAVKAPARDGKANVAAKTLLAKHLGISPAKLSLIRGADRPSKIFLQRE